MNGQDLGNILFNQLSLTNRVMSAAYQQQPESTLVKSGPGMVEFINTSTGEVKTIRHCEED